MLCAFHSRLGSAPNPISKLASGRVSSQYVSPMPFWKRSRASSDRAITTRSVIFLRSIVSANTVNAAYKRSGYDRAFYDANIADILIHRAAKKYFNAQGFEGKLPSINSLKQEWATLNTECKTLYGNCKGLRDKHAALGTAKANAENIIGIGKSEAQIVAERIRSRSYTHER